jgi:hypothetical protein
LALGDSSDERVVVGGVAVGITIGEENDVTDHSGYLAELVGGGLQRTVKIRPAAIPQLGNFAEQLGPISREPH